MLLEQLSSLPSMAPRSNPMLRPITSQSQSHSSSSQPSGTKQSTTENSQKTPRRLLLRGQPDLLWPKWLQPYLADPWNKSLSLIRWPLAPIASRQIGGEVDSLKFGLLLLLLLLHVLASFAAGLKVHSWLGFKSSKSHICRFRSKSLACKLSPRGSFIFMQCNALQCFNNVSQWVNESLSQWQGHL